MSNILIAYFSRADENYFDGELKYVDKGNTQIVAEIIKELTGGDTFKIEMKEPYSDKYMECIEEAKKDKKSHTHPELTNYLDSIDEYDTVILGYPNYWGTYPMAVETFLEKYDFDGKRVLPICTNEGSGMGSSEKHLKREIKGANIADGISIHGSQAKDSKEAIKKWLIDNELI
ncbi:MAG: NAD(P)H-dependent oxidoreductase [Lachnospiraceae bacterium]|nr:NAD(P)H-dependent oxidoreductase [Lachnospiraceae bacterium]